MTTRTTERTVTFARPFFLTALGADQPAGAYIVRVSNDGKSKSHIAYRRD